LLESGHEIGADVLSKVLSSSFTSKGNWRLRDSIIGFRNIPREGRVQTSHIVVQVVTLVSPCGLHVVVQFEQPTVDLEARVCAAITTVPAVVFVVLPIVTNAVARTPIEVIQHTTCFVLSGIGEVRTTV
jgi:hypothetical protein